MNNAGKIFRGTILHIIKNSQQNPELQIINDGGLAVNINGIIEYCDTFTATQKSFPKHEIIDTKGSVICPGFVDTHSHMPQLNMIGCYGDGLLDWLETNTFPEEIKFKNAEYASKTAQRFANLLLRNGVTSAVIFTATFAQATDAMFQAAANSNLRAIIGKVSMDQHAPQALLQDAATDYEDQKNLISKWHNYDSRLQYALTPRFAPTTSTALFKNIQKLYQEHQDIWLQTHHSENKKEIAFVKELFPKAKHYLDVYDQYDLLGPKTILAHSIHATDAEVERIIETKTIISHCPTSNLFLGSGLMPLNDYRQKGLRLSLGCDIGGGTSISPWKTMDEAYKVQALRGDKPSPTYLFYLATLGGAEALAQDHIYGNFVVGKEADFQILDYSRQPLYEDRPLVLETADKTLLPMIMLSDDRVVKEVYVRGKKIVFQ